MTGASSGVGLETAAALARCGARLVLLARGDTDERAARLAAAVAACKALGAEAHALAVDLRDLDAADATSRSVLAEHGAPDVVIANAGHSIERLAIDSSERAHDLARTAGVHHLGHGALMLPWLPHLRQGSRIVGVTTATATVPTPRFAAYVAAKSALDVWLRTLRIELAHRAVAVSTVRLPLVRTRMVAAHRSLDWALTAREAAGIVCGAVTHPRAVVAPRLARTLAALAEVAPDATASLVVRAAGGARVLGA